MKKRLSKTDFMYLQILYAIWRLVMYYSHLFQIDVKEPAKTVADITQKDGVTHLQITFSRIENSEIEYSALEMKDIFNEYLRYVLLPNQKLIPPYQNGTGIYDLIESLYIDMVYLADSYILLDVVYIDNPLAFKYVREQEKILI
ncbi:MAG: hypothetical protein E7299_06855 [Lachnospiraceae bacterium]|nr:hypothetical protein [Lachnospiraceae bacterium]